ncbi:hypothetical protein NMY22_g201 [Coprinellus aureogranulatus]|nr:hypothetical protein NMY22_g201 [Coprinellus aureogranulatus]
MREPLVLRIRRSTDPYDGLQTTFWALVLRLTAAPKFPVLYFNQTKSSLRSLRRIDFPASYKIENSKKLGVRERRKAVVLFCLQGRPVQYRRPRRCRVRFLGHGRFQAIHTRIVLLSAAWRMLPTLHALDTSKLIAGSPSMSLEHIDMDLSARLSQRMEAAVINAHRIWGMANTPGPQNTLCPLPYPPLSPMFKNSSNIHAGVVSQVNAKTYIDHGTTSRAVTNEGSNGNTTNIKAGVYNHHEVRVADPLRELYAHVASGAMNNSDDRADAPKCHPKTRKAVQQNIFSWMYHREREGEPRQLLWLTGPAGAGKTAIMGTISDKLEERGELAASFYFASYTGSAETSSKRGFVTTLAYQLQGHTALKDRLSKHILFAVQEDPAVFRRSLRRQMEVLILAPLRHAGVRRKSRSRTYMAIVIDGIDECGKNTHDDPNRLGDKDQIEILSVLLQALLDSAFPFKIIVASRPETWIRRFLTETAAGHFTEIFLDNSYNPDKDIELFLRAKFSELSRRYSFAPSTWPREEDIQSLVSNASGQFIYPAIVIRFIDSHGQPPKKQLDIVLRATPPTDGASPFAALDALYIAVLNSSPSPSETALWLKACQRLSYTPAGFPSPSVWTIDRLFESSEGQAQLLFGLPSLVFTPSNTGTDSPQYGQQLQVPRSSIPNPSWGSIYSFYHKSFLDFLDSPARSGTAFPDVTDEGVVKWIWERFHRVWKRAGPEVPIDEALLSTFRTCFADILWFESRRTSWNPPILRQEVLSECSPAAWYTGSSAIEGEKKAQFLCHMFILVHTQCRSYPCGLEVLGTPFCLTGSASSALKDQAPAVSICADKRSFESILASPKDKLGAGVGIIACVEGTKDEGSAVEVVTLVWVVGTKVDAVEATEFAATGRIAFAFAFAFVTPANTLLYHSPLITSSPLPVRGLPYTSRHPLRNRKPKEGWGRDRTRLDPDFAFPEACMAPNAVHLRSFPGSVPLPGCLFVRESVTLNLEYSPL